VVENGGWVPGLHMEQKLKIDKEDIKYWIKKSPQKPREEEAKYKKNLVDLQEEMETKDINNIHIM
jgi:hypothetical protein